MTEIDDVVSEFFRRYGDALLARDEAAVAELYAVPALILFPGQSIAVTDRTQTEQFFASAWGQYEGVDETTNTIDVVASGEHSIWADVTWFSGGRARERFVYQLVGDAGEWKIGVLTPIG
ncbi:DUF4440 domain-containing protein [Herbiconiux sp. L3-i23]|uniref:DUF4440 domain-containing protein n=1 Tax=Herbiconiux sp. L3-i23 TaxID=2905871 RepID=UPI00206DF84D|nr:DUF4440 domain-containing protein [Herbiconiux sp. L3-i23]BDI23690.1 hypothetical protein L3i23_24660 [Herbiconiux sp. L3-i23]